LDYWSVGGLGGGALGDDGGWRVLGLDAGRSREAASEELCAVLFQRSACQDLLSFQVPRMSAKAPDEETQPTENDPAEFEVEEAGEESFPASDPPGWTRGRDSEEEQADIKPE
jgi:hypothetical protein